MKKIILAFIFTVLLCGFYAQARAETDYPCLNTCIKSGKTAALCLPQCTREDPAAHQRPKPSVTDYRCFNLCTSGGKPAAACLSQCTYVPSSSAKLNLSPSPAEGAQAASHNVLQAPVPAGNTLLFSPHPVQTATPTKNYSCIAQCLHDGMQEELCNQNCIGVTPEFNAGR